jgi:hypothetical protein
VSADEFGPAGSPSYRTNRLAGSRAVMMRQVNQPISRPVLNGERGPGEWLRLLDLLRAEMQLNRERPADGAVVVRRINDQHADFFIRNMVLMILEVHVVPVDAP